MYNKLNLAIGKVASKHSIKPELNAIAFYGNKTVATDSFRLLEVSATGEVLKEPVLLNAKHLKGNLKITPDSILELDEILTRSAAVPIKGMFPAYEEILEPAFKREDDIKISLNGKMLSEMLAILASTNKLGRVEISIPQKAMLPIVMSAKTKTTKDEPIPQVVRGLLMPMSR